MGKIDRYTTQDLNAILFRALSSLRETISGGIYFRDERPPNSDKEDIVINTPSVTMDVLQSAYSNVNVYVPKIHVNAVGGPRYARNRRAQEIAESVIAKIEEYVCNGVIFVESETEETAPDGSEQFTNLRLQWRINKQL